MSFGWSDLLVYAENIQQKEAPTEAELRAAISRAYYSVHNLAAESVLSETKQKKGHSDLISHYRLNRENTDFQEAGKILSGLRFDRISADYHLDRGKLGKDLKKKLQSVITQSNEFKRLTGL